MPSAAAALQQVLNNREIDFYETMEYLISHIEGEVHVCSHFGCGKHLTLQEQRFGNKCINHQRKNMKE